MIWRDRQDFGIRFITPDDPHFGEMAIRISLDPFGRKPELPLPEGEFIAVNQSTKALLAMSFLWKWGGLNGDINVQRMSGLHSLAQLDWPSEKHRNSWFSPFLSGSKRLVTPQGVFGDNSDVLPPEAKPTGFVGSFAGPNRRGAAPQRKFLEVQLDSVIFDDGLCAGPDQMGIFDTIVSVATEQRRLASEAIALLRSGRGVGTVFELLRGAAQPPGPASIPATPDPLHLLFSFARHAVDRLVNVRKEHIEDLINWLEIQRQQPRLRLRRA